MAKDPAKHGNIRQKMREVGRLHLAGRELSEMKTMKDFILLSNFPLFEEAVKHLAGYDCDNRSFKIPSLPLKLGHSLMRIASMVEGQAMIARSKESRPKCSRIPTDIQNILELNGFLICIKNTVRSKVEHPSTLALH